ncbi:hypothetical protein AX769_16800 [Frondihabitans sp. PAMC 28766]|uniref:class I mannose-6-phosphate isomerase n=1 Tax=Frondihabitans sp. PAMC 28766 TaxID=1795630 RepID=UPI00078BFF61|nr:class I mannose-6-phosphate isomerase [Frondihabitans sp. PAMC 28766]AMM21491.1 hypothetical protein AX769_16800 [Frondihabitans sp. PAMC 28766]
MDPLALAPNQPADRAYRGGAGILALRGIGSTDDHVPEDFIASTTSVHGTDGIGLTVLDDGMTLKDAISLDPIGYLGLDHVNRYGADTGLLVKILSTGERLFNHVHPDAAFAAAHLGSPRGKTEAWLITDTGAGSGTVWLGFRDEVDLATLRRLVVDQDTSALLGALNELTVTAGDWVFVPAGTPHAIGDGITLVELQEPSDLSILLEYRGFPGIDPAGAFLGLDLDTALGAVDFQPLVGPMLAAVHGHAEEGNRVRLLPTGTDAFFRAELVAPAEPVILEPSFAVLIALDGVGELAWEGGSRALGRGDVILVPYDAGSTVISGSVRAIRCLPPV